MILDQDSQDWQALWRAQEGEVTAMKSEVVCAKSASPPERKMKIEFWGAPLLLVFRRKSGIQFHSVSGTSWIRAGWAWGVVTFTYAAARWVQFGMPGRLYQATGSENCADFLHAELNTETDAHARDALDSTTRIPWFRRERWLGRGACGRRKTPRHQLAHASPLSRVAWTVD